MNDDLISRRAAIDALHKKRIETMKKGQDVNHIWECLDVVAQVPSVQPERRSFSCGQENDMISRQMLLEYIHGEPVGKLLCDKYNLDGLIEQFPSAQPYTEDEIQKMQDLESAEIEKAFQLGREDALSEQSDIIGCGDCKYWICHDRRCGFWNHGVKPLDWCSYAKRREG